ncbi:hypothetical protein AB0E08_49215 [Streptomyces sp. NPDC048281]|uniref:hypothetical protein n=1 Tax=Streptomyces sp. NPDC048281 TaxID=3154715 RepID=UPI003417E010
MSSNLNQPSTISSLPYFSLPMALIRWVGGRVLSLDADLGGMSLYDLVVSEVDFLRDPRPHLRRPPRRTPVIGLRLADRRGVVG